MKLKDIYSQNDYQVEAKMFKAKKPVISYEVFPPKGENTEMPAKIDALLSELKLLTKFNPAFISVTYGAGGSTQEKTLDIVLKIKNELGINPMPHFTCVGSTRGQIKDYISIIEENGINNILALRGDPPKGQEHFVKPEGGFGYANELVEFIKNNTNLSIAVAGYPEKHPECKTMEEDIENLKRKVDAGADAIITQVFFDNDYYFDFVEKLGHVGIDVPVIPGILPITNLSQVERMMSLCGSKIPEVLINRLKQHQNDPDAIRETGIEFAVYQCRPLVDAGAAGIHFYTLNKAYATSKVIENLSIGL